MHEIRVALVGDYDPEVTAHRAIPLALELASQAAGTPASWDWVGTATIGANPALRLSRYDAIWCVPASPYASMAGALSAIRFARESGRPFLGTCGGCQHALIEYARDVLGLDEADHAETNPDAKLPVVSALSCALVEKSARIRIVEGSVLSRIYPVMEIEETYHCSYGVNQAFQHLLFSSGIRISARDTAGEVRAFELVGHPFFIGTLFQPERAALAGRRHSLIDAFLSAAADRHRSVDIAS
ncbi:MAG: CTP synthase [Spirochaetia bacterium]